MVINEIIIAVLSGAVGGSLISALFESVKIKSKLKTNYLRKQIDYFYGPLCIILSHSSKNLEIAKSILSAHKDYFSRNDWSQEERTQQNLQSESTATVAVSNEYVAEANTNNEKIFKIIMNNYSLIDLEDIGTIEDFLKNYARLCVEHTGDTKLPFMIYRIVGNISFLPTNFKNVIEEKFMAKKIQLENQSTLWGSMKSCIKIGRKNKNFLKPNTKS